MSLKGEEAYVLGMSYTEESLEGAGALKGQDGKSAYQIWLDLGNTGTEQDFIDSLKVGENPLYLVTGSLDMENEDNPLTIDQTFEEIKTAYNKGKTIVADILVAGEAQYIFNLLYILEDAIAFEWINSAAKVGGQINLMSDNTVTFTMTSLEGEEAPSTLVIKGNYTTEDDNWIVSNIDKTFSEIDEAITNNQDVVLKIYPEGDTTNPYILHPAMHYANMGTAFSLVVCDEGQISGLSVMITADNQIMASRNEYEFEEFYKELDEIKKSVSDGKSAVAGAITAKGIDTAADAEFATMVENISKIEAPVIDLKYSEGTKDLFSSYVASIVAGSNTFVAWGYADKSMYYSEDGGKTWQLSNLANLTSLNDPTIIYAKEYDIFAILLSATGHGVYISQDGGKTWTLQMGYSNVNTLAYSNGIFVGCSSNTTSGGITYSPDGVYWSLNANFSSKAITNLKCVNNRWFFVCDGNTYTSADGYNWTALTGTVSGSKLTNIIYYQGVWLASAIGSSTAVFYSNDGVTWNACAFNWNNAQYGNSIQALSRIGNTYVASTYNGMYYSTDRGKTWNASNITAGNHKLQLFAGKLLALGDNGPRSGKGVYTSADGKTWTQATTFPNASNTNGKVFIKNGKILVTGSDSALYVSSNGNSWTKVEDSCTLYSEFNGILIAKQFKYSLDGINWKSIKPADTTQTLAEYYYFGCNTILACSTPLGVYYSKPYFS